MAEQRASAPARLDHGRLLFYGWMLYWVVLTGLLLSPKLPRSPVQISQRGLVAHFVAFGLLSIGWVVAVRARGVTIGAGRATVWTVVFGIYGGLVELLQPLVNRSCDWADSIANVSGAAVFMLVGYLVFRPSTAVRR